MHEAYFGLKESPFAGDRRRKYFHASPTHEEALARLGFLIDAGYALGILSGFAGSGRSTILDVLAGNARRRGHVACLANLLGSDERGLLWTLAAQLGTNPRPSDDPFLLGNQIRDRLQQHALLGRKTVLLLDDADQASHEVLVQVLRLLKTQLHHLTIVLAIESARMGRLGGDLLQLSQLRIRLEPWSTSDIREFLRCSLAKAGCRHTVFDASAATRLQELTDGIPRWVSQLAELALVAAASQQRETIGGELVEAVYQELSASFEEEPAAAA